MALPALLRSGFACRVWAHARTFAAQTSRAVQLCHGASRRIACEHLKKLTFQLGVLHQLNSLPKWASLTVLEHVDDDGGTPVFPAKGAHACRVKLWHSVPLGIVPLGIVPLGIAIDWLPMPSGTCQRTTRAFSASSAALAWGSAGAPARRPAGAQRSPGWEAAAAGTATAIDSIDGRFFSF